MKPTVLFVDDDLNVRESIKRIFRRLPYRILALESAEHCSDVLAATDIQVLVTDLAMPDMSGQSVVHYFKANKPDIIRIVLSGKLDLSTTLDLINEGEVFRILEKPCPAPRLLAAVSAACALWEKTHSGSSLSKQAWFDKDPFATGDAAIQTSLIHDALEDVERLETSLKDHCERGRPISEK